MNYTFHQLQIFVKICETGSITRASEEMFLTQPAVSIQLKKFQDQFDIPLTELIGRKIFITDFGKEIAVVCKNIIAESDEIENKALQYKGLLAGKLSISVVSTGKYVMPYFMTDFIKKHPSVDIRIDVTNKKRVLESLMNNETDFSLVSVVPEDLSVESMSLLKNRLFLVANQSSGISNEINKNQLSKIPFIYREEGSATRNAMENFFKSKGVTPNSKLELVSNEAVKQAVCAGLGCSIMPIIGMSNELERGDLKIVKTAGLPIETTWRLIYNKGKVLSPVAQAFIKHVEMIKDEVVEGFFRIDELNGENK